MKNYYFINNNTLNRSIQNYIDTSSKGHNKAHKMLTRDITIFYSEVFTGEDLKAAENALKKKNDMIPLRDAIKISLMGGGCIVLIIVLIVLVMNMRNDTVWIL